MKAHSNIFLLEPTEDSPLVRLDPEKGHMLFQGRSYMEDTSTYFIAIIDWFRNYMTNPRTKNVVELEFEYINSSSQAMLFNLLNEIDKYYIMGHDFTILWKFHHEDESLDEYGEELAEMFEVPVVLKALV